MFIVEFDFISQMTKSIAFSCDRVNIFFRVWWAVGGKESSIGGTEERIREKRVVLIFFK